nr:SEC-C metal-binding domain-containing protein [Vagococcus salmoninarum]
MAQKVFSEKKMENVTSQAQEWFAAFELDQLFTELPKDVQTQVETVTAAFSEWMYREELRAGREWTAGSLENILVNVFPRELAAYPTLKQDLLLILTNYFTFLKNEKKISNADTLVRKLESLDFSNTEEASIVETKKKPVQATKTKKSMKAPTYSAGEIAQFNRFAMGNEINQRVASKPVVQEVKQVEKVVGRNEPCPCGSGKKYKKCHGK